MWSSAFDGTGLEIKANLSLLEMLVSIKYFPLRVIGQKKSRDTIYPS